MTAKHTAAGVVPLILLIVAGCSSTPGRGIDDAMRDQDGLAVAGSSHVLQYLEPHQRTYQVNLEGKTLSGTPWSAADEKGSVLVVNVWGSWCPPCVTETPHLVQVANHFTDEAEQVSFIGLNVRDSVPTAQAFERKYDIPYPSLTDDGGRTLSMLDGYASASPPVTLIFDQQGLLAARINGQTDETTLTGLIEDTLASSL